MLAGVFFISAGPSGLPLSSVVAAAVLSGRQRRGRV